MKGEPAVAKANGPGLSLSLLFLFLLLLCFEEDVAMLLLLLQKEEEEEELLLLRKQKPCSASFRRLFISCFWFFSLFTDKFLKNDPVPRLQNPPLAAWSESQ